MFHWMVPVDGLAKTMVSRILYAYWGIPAPQIQPDRLDDGWRLPPFERKEAVRT